MVFIIYKASCQGLPICAPGIISAESIGSISCVIHRSWEVSIISHPIIQQQQPAITAAGPAVFAAPRTLLILQSRIGILSYRGAIYRKILKRTNRLISILLDNHTLPLAFGFFGSMCSFGTFMSLYLVCILQVTIVIGQYLESILLFE